jgi:hypothetical protein
MTEYEESSLKSIANNINITYSEEKDSSNYDINNSSYILNHGTKLNLSGVDLSSEEGVLLLNDIFQKYPNLTDINLNNCNLNELPNELFNFKSVSSLDIRNNIFQNFDKLIQDLTKFNNLKELKIDLNNQDKVLLVLTNIPKLTSLNEKSTKNQSSIVDIDIKDIEDISLDNDLDEYSEIVGNLNKKDNSNSFLNRFKKRLSEEGEKIKDCLTKNVPNYIYANATLKSKVELQKILAEKFIKYLDEENGFIGNFLFKIIFQTSDKLIDLINHLYPKIEEKTDNIRNELEKAWKAADEISDYENKYKNIVNQKNILESNIELLQKKINKL